MKSAFSCLIRLASAIFIIGCQPPDPIEGVLGDKAPAFGIAPEHKTIAGFVVGKWQIANGMNGQTSMTDDVYEFKADKSFTFIRQ